MQEMYTHIGPQFRDELLRHHLPTSMVNKLCSSSAVCYILIVLSFAIFFNMIPYFR